MLRLSPLQRIAYSSGAFAKSVQWNSTDFILLYYLADIQQLGVQDAGLILLLSLFWLGFLDIGVALYFDRKKVCYQKVIAVATPFCVASFAVLFLPLHIEQQWKFEFYLIAALVFRLGYTFIDIPHNALMGTLTSSSVERTHLSVLRVFFNSCAVLLFAIFAGDILGVLEPGDSSWHLGILIGCSALLLVNLTACVAPIWHIRDEICSNRPFQVREAFLAILKNRPFLILLLFTLTAEAMLPIVFKSSVYYASVVLDDEAQTSWLIVGLAIGKILALGAFSLPIRTMEKRQGMIIACLGQSLCFVLLWLWLPQTTLAASFLFLLCGFFSGKLHVLIWSALPDTIEYGRYHFKVANQALTFGVYHLVMRISNGLSFGLLALVLTGIGYEHGKEDLGDQLVLFTALLSAAGGIVGAIIISRYPISHAVHKQVTAALRARTSAPLVQEQATPD